MPLRLTYPLVGSTAAGMTYLMSKTSLWAAATRAWRLAGEAYKEEAPARRLKQRVRWSLAAALHPAIALEWFDGLDTVEMQRSLALRPSLRFKPLRVYVSTAWSHPRKVKVIRDTYRFLRFRGERFLPVLADSDGIELATFSMGPHGQGALRLGWDERFRKEGELALFLICPGLGGRLAAATFSLESRRNGRWACLVGCVQGRALDEAGVSKAAQKAMYGLRPKSLMVIAVQELAAALGLDYVVGAGKRIQVHRRKHAIHIPFLHGLTFDYDAIWVEGGARPMPGGWFLLPRTPQRKAPGEIKANKRAMYAKRYRFLDELAEAIRRAVD